LKFIRNKNSISANQVVQESSRVVTICVSLSSNSQTQREAAVELNINPGSATGNNSTCTSVTIHSMLNCISYSW